MSTPPVRDRLSTRIVRAWRRALDRIGGTSEGNQITLFFDGDDAFEAMLHAIRSATSSVWLEAYRLEPDRVGREFLAALTQAARRGVQVLLLFDGVGSLGLGVAHTAPVVAAGGRVLAFNPPRLFRPRPTRLSVWMRDHRKVLVVDGAAGFCGGMNLSEDYAGARLGNGRFRDTHILVEGPAAHDLGATFAASWRQASGEHLALEAARSPMKRGIRVQVVASDAARGRRQIQRALYHAVGHCRESCYLTSPYFLPPARLLRQLVRAARRGVDVRILMAGLSDVPLATVAARHLYTRLLANGVRIFEMDKRTLHAKAAVVDGLFVSVGSFNLDRWSFGRNLEVNLIVLEKAVADQLVARFVDDLALSREVRFEDERARGLWERLIGWAAYQLARL